MWEEGNCQKVYGHTKLRTHSTPIRHPTAADFRLAEAWHIKERTAIVVEDRKKDFWFYFVVTQQENEEGGPWS